MITQSLAALYLLVVPWFTDTYDKTVNRFLFQVTPTIIGVVLAFQVYGKFMGWPV